MAAKMLHLSDAVAGDSTRAQGAPLLSRSCRLYDFRACHGQVLEGEGAIARNRELMGATNPQEADSGTIRADFAQSIDANAVHGSDSPSSAEREIAYFFASSEICSR